MKWPNKRGHEGPEHETADVECAHGAQVLAHVGRIPGDENATNGRGNHSDTGTEEEASNDELPGIVGRRHAQHGDHGHDDPRMNQQPDMALIGKASQPNLGNDPGIKACTRD